MTWLGVEPDMSRRFSVLMPSQPKSVWSARARGFSLIELMVTVGIVALLAAIAYPSYLRYTVKSNRSAAQSYLMDAAQRQQQFLLDSRAYAGSPTILNDIPPPVVLQFYQVSFTTDPACPSPLQPPCFVLTAAPLAGTMQASDSTLTIDSAGNRAPTNLW
jgi:type IV pilus assembly protein PilE